MSLRAWTTLISFDLLFYLRCKTYCLTIGKLPRNRCIGYRSQHTLLNQIPLVPISRFSSEVSDNSAGNIIDGDMKERKRSRSKLRIKKVRQHVNPLASRYRRPIVLNPDWISHSFKNISSPFIVDVGCSRGSWAIKLGENEPDVNILGLEIRLPVIEEALVRKSKRNLTNVHFMYCNVNVDIHRILNDLSMVSTINMITIQFPDPHFKKKHHKRRVLNTQLLNTISYFLKPKQLLFIQSDVIDIMEDMMNRISEARTFDPAPGYNLDIWSSNPSPTNVKTEREIATESKNLPVYRMLFQRNDIPSTLPLMDTSDDVGVEDDPDNEDDDEVVDEDSSSSRRD